MIIQQWGININNIISFKHKKAPENSGAFYL